MEFRVLGPLEVLDGDRPLGLGGRKPRALLARLLLEPNRTVSVERLVDDLWGEDVPDSAVKMVHIHVSQLRKALPDGILRTRPPGYALEVEPEAIDLVRFERLRDAGRAALDSGDAGTAAARLREALELWRGLPLAEFAEPFARTEAAHLEERARVCLEDRIDAELALGLHDDLAGELEVLVGRHPLRERLRAQHMRALYRSGRHAEALAAYREFRAVLDEERGIEPSPHMRDLERQILRHDTALAGAPPEPVPRHELDPIHYVQSGGGHSIAYQVVGDGPLDIVFVHGWVCAFQTAWEWPALASFYTPLV